MAGKKITNSPELQILQELVEIDAMECPMILVTVEGEDTTNCPRCKTGCLCAKLPGEKLVVKVPGESV